MGSAFFIYHHIKVTSSQQDSNLRHTVCVQFSPEVDNQQSFDVVYPSFFKEYWLEPAWTHGYLTASQMSFQKTEHVF